MPEIKLRSPKCSQFEPVFGSTARGMQYVTRSTRVATFLHLLDACWAHMSGRLIVRLELLELQQPHCINCLSSPQDLHDSPVQLTACMPTHFILFYLSYESLTLCLLLFYLLSLSSLPKPALQAYSSCGRTLSLTFRCAVACALCQCGNYLSLLLILHISSSLKYKVLFHLTY
jgi:hypothetical protein